MESLGTDSDDSQINREPIRRANFPDKMNVVFEIHRARFATTVAGIVEPDGRVENIARVIEDHDIVPDIHVLIAVCPFGARDRLVTGRPQFPDLF
jgi:hypothetical protein